MGPPAVPGVQGPYGTPVPMAAPYSSAPPRNPLTAQQMMAQSVPMSMVQMNYPGGMPGGMPGMPPGGMMPATPVPAGGVLSPPGMPFGPGAPPGGTVSPTSGQPMMPGAGVTQATFPPGAMAGGEIQQAQFAMNPANAGLPAPTLRTQVRFLRPIGMQVSWFTQGPAGQPIYSPTPIETPGKYNFVQSARYRLKLTNIKGAPAGVELYPTLEVYPATHKTEAFLAHNSVPVEFTDEDFKQVADGNYVVKVIYLPDPQFQDIAGNGIDVIVSTPLEPGQDPIQEALRRGTILLVVRMGNIDQEAPNTPPLAAPGPAGIMPPGPGGHGPQFGPTQPGVMNPPVQVPFWGMGQGGPLSNAPGAYPPGTPPGLMPQGVVPPGAIPPGALPPGAMPPGAAPPGVLPPGAIPPGAIPPGAMPPGAVPPGPLPGGPIPGPAVKPPVAPLPPPSPDVPKALPGTDAKVLPSPTSPLPVTPVSVPPTDTGNGKGATPTSPAQPVLPPAPASQVNAPSPPSLPPALPPVLPPGLPSALPK
jgi:hypothetical protein